MTTPDDAMANCDVEVLLTSLVLDIAAIQQRIEDVDCGAQLIFLGCTRRTTGDQVTTFLVYDAYQPMAENELRNLAQIASQRWPLRKIVIHHRMGRVDVGQASVIVAAASPHRPAVMEAVPWIMDRLKQEVPIWKKENFADGSQSWVHPKP